MKKNTWNVRRLVNKSFVPSAQRTSVLYCRLTDFIFRVSHEVWSYDKFSVDRQLHKTTLSSIVYLWIILQNCQDLKYFRDILDLKETTSDVKTVFCHVHKQENFIGQFYWLVLFIVEIFTGQYFSCLKKM